MITIVDYGVGNLASIQNMMRRLMIECEISSDPAVVMRSNKLILPGVGAFDSGMSFLGERGLIEPIRLAVRDRKVPLLGICLGMQLLGHGSDEGSMGGLGLIPMRCRRIVGDRNTGIKTIHMGWNEVKVARDSALLRGYERPPRFYFVHGYRAECDDQGDVLGTTEYGDTFASVVGRDNVMGVQFHPEKSHKFGYRLFKNFSEI